MGKSSGKETWEYATVRRPACAEASAGKAGERRKAKGKRIRINDLQDLHDIRIKYEYKKDINS
jgi:hypothetical protein